jgi:hypothetical protein
LGCAPVWLTLGYAVAMPGLRPRRSSQLDRVSARGCVAEDPTWSRSRSRSRGGVARGSPSAWYRERSSRAGRRRWRCPRSIRLGSRIPAGRCFSAVAPTFVERNWLPLSECDLGLAGAGNTTAFPGASHGCKPAGSHAADRQGPTADHSHDRQSTYSSPPVTPETV